MALTNIEFQKEIERNGEIIKKTNPKASREKVKEEVNIRSTTIKSTFNQEILSSFHNNLVYFLHLVI